MKKQSNKTSLNKYLLQKDGILEFTKTKSYRLKIPSWLLDRFKSKKQRGDNI